MPYDPELSRFRVYVLRDGEPHELCSTNRDGLGLALTTMHEEGDLTDDDRVGILDRVEGETGTWIVNPWAVGR